MRILFSLLILLMLSTAAHCASIEPIGLGVINGQESPLEITADALGNQGEDVVTAEGNVLAKWNKWNLTASKINYNRVGKVLVAEGDVELRDDIGNSMKCKNLTLALANMTGSATGVVFYLPETGYIIEADSITWTGQNSFEANGTRLTTCDGSFMSWNIEAAWIKVIIEGYIYGTNGVFWMESAPLFYLPVFVFPAKLTRQTGFLIPRVGYSNVNGYILADRFFWAINESADLLYSFDYRSKKGIKESASFRYVLDEDQGGSVKVEHYLDNAANTDDFNVKANHLSVFSQNTVLSARADLSTDHDTQIKFADNVDERALNQTTSHFYYGQGEKPGTLFFNTEYTQSANSSDETIIQRIGSAGFWGTLSPLYGPVFWQNQTQVDYFNNREGLDAGRFRTSQSLAIDADVGPLGLGAKGGYRANLYSYNTETQNNNVARGAPYAEASAWLSFARSFDGRYLHTVEPMISYKYQDQGEGGQTPYLDEYDVFASSSNAYFSLATELYDTNANLMLFRAEIAKAMGLVEEKKLTDDKLITGELELKPFSALSLYTDAVYDADYGRGLMRWSGMAGLSDKPGRGLWVKYQYAKDKAEFIDSTLVADITHKLGVTLQNRYSLMGNRTIEDSASLTYRHSCWTLTGNFLNSYRRDTDDFERMFILTLSLTGVGQAGSIRW